MVDWKIGFSLKGLYDSIIKKFVRNGMTAGYNKIIHFTYPRMDEKKKKYYPISWSPAITCSHKCPMTGASALVSN